MEIILATTNLDKFKQLASYFKDIDLSLVMPKDKIIVEEDKPTLQENAEKKALACSALYPKQFVVATDGGIVIPFLGENWNHVLTHRLSGLDVDIKLSNRKRCEILLELLKDAKGEERRVSWREAYAIARNEQIIFSEELSGVDDHGVLLDHIPTDFEESGFSIGYLWYEKKFKKSYMTLTDEEKKSLQGTTAEFIQLVKEKKIFSSF
jgi:inosine/xanthosine triphosphate pyrophosphatase family protein